MIMRKYFSGMVLSWSSCLPIWAVVDVHVTPLDLMQPTWVNDSQSEISHHSVCFPSRREWMISFEDEAVGQLEPRHCKDSQYILSLKAQSGIRSWRHPVPSTLTHSRAPTTLTPVRLCSIKATRSVHLSARAQRWGQPTGAAKPGTPLTYFILHDTPGGVAQEAWRQRGWATKYQGCECINPHHHQPSPSTKGRHMPSHLLGTALVCRPNERQGGKKWGCRDTAAHARLGMHARYVSCRGPHHTPNPIIRL